MKKTSSIYWRPAATARWTGTSPAIESTGRGSTAPARSPAANGASMLVWFEEYPDMRSTLRRLQQIDRAGHDWKVRLIEQAESALG